MPRDIPIPEPPEPVTDQEPEADGDAGTEPGGRRLDPELCTMGAMLRLLESLPEPARGRVVQWLGSRYQPPRP